MMTGCEYGKRMVVPDGLTLREWLVGMGFQGILASGKNLGRLETVAIVNAGVDSILDDLAKKHESLER